MSFSSSVVSRMVQLSVLIPARDAGDEVARQLPEVIRAAAALAETFEVIGIDDGGQFESVQLWRRLLTEYPQLRVLRLEERQGLSAALAAGIAAAKGQIIVTMEPGPRYLPEQISWLTERLSRADLVHGRRRRSRLVRFLQAFTMWPRRLLFGVEVRDPTCLFWAARREAVAGLDLGRGMHRFVGALMAVKGFRVCEITVDHRPARRPRGHFSLPSLMNLLVVWYLRKIVQHPTYDELARFESRIDGRQLRVDPARKPGTRVSPKA